MGFVGSSLLGAADITAVSFGRLVEPVVFDGGNQSTVKCSILHKRARNMHVCFKIRPS